MMWYARQKGHGLLFLPRLKLLSQESKREHTVQVFLTYYAYYRYNSAKHPVLFQASGEPIKKSIARTTEDMVDTLVEEDEEVSESEESGSSLGNNEDISDSKFIKETKKRKSGSQAGSSQSKRAKKKN